MQEVEALDFFERVTDEDGQKEETKRTLSVDDGAALTVTVTGVDRNWLFDQLDRLPDEILAVIAGAEDPEEANEEAVEEDLLTNVNGETLRTFEDICARGLSHPELTKDHWEAMVAKFDLEALFPAGAQIMQETLGAGGKINGFHEPE